MQRRGQRDLRFYEKLSGLDQSIKQALRYACSQSNLSREQIVDAANELAAVADIRLTNGNAERLTPAILDRWLAATATDQMPPLRSLAVLCEVVGSVEPLNAAAALCGGRVIDRVQAKQLRLVEISGALDDLKTEQKEIRKWLKVNV